MELTPDQKLVEDFEINYPIYICSNSLLDTFWYEIWKLVERPSCFFRRGEGRRRRNIFHNVLNSYDRKELHSKLVST